MKKISIIIFCILILCIRSNGQTFLRYFLITKDTVLDWWQINGSTEGVSGIYLFTTQDSDINKTKVVGFYHQKFGNMNGTSLGFYKDTNMPAEKGNYKDNVNDGVWYYWDEEGFLVRKEIWKCNKLIKTIKYKAPQIDSTIKNKKINAVHNSLRANNAIKSKKVVRIIKQKSKKIVEFQKF